MTPRGPWRSAAAAAACVLLAACARGPATLEGPSADAGRIAGDAYYLGECARCGGTLGTRGETIAHVYRSRDLRFCGDPCRRAFEQDAAAGLERVDQRMIADQLALYPLAVSIVSGRALPARPVDVIVGNRLVRIAEPAERAALEREPSRYLRALDRAVIEAQRPRYGMPDKCPVQGDILASDTPLDIVVANRMIRVCCGRCAAVVRARPSQYLAMVDYANRAGARPP